MMSTPTTPFEDRGLVGPWTTHEEEAEYLSALKDRFPHIREEIIGEASLGQPLRMFKFGSGHRHVFFISGVHAGEISGRDALFTLMREWAEPSTPEMVDYLKQVTLLIVPTMRPDSQTARNNPNGVNLNRDHVRLSQSETQAIHRVVRDYEPVVSVDLHEGNNITNHYATSKPLNPNVRRGIADLSHDLEQSIRGALESDGWTWEPYQNHNITGPQYGHNTFALRHSIGILLESRRNSSAGNNLNTDERYTTQKIAIEEILSWHLRNIREVDLACQSSRRSMSDAVSEVHFPPHTASSWPIVSPAPDGYIIDSAGKDSISVPAEIFDLDIADGMVSTRHPAKFLVHSLLDQESSEMLAQGERQYFGDPATPIVRRVAGYKFKDGGTTYNVYRKGLQR